ncbi:MAG: hypothetical protein QM736_27710 [Vicinamibacterales bacterium]
MLAGVPIGALAAQGTAPAPSPTTEQPAAAPAPDAAAPSSPSTAQPGQPAGGTDPWAALGLPPAGASSNDASANGADDPWNFDEAVQQESWSDILRPQIADLAITHSVLRLRPRQLLQEEPRAQVRRARDVGGVSRRDQEHAHLRH